MIPPDRNGHTGGGYPVRELYRHRKRLSADSTTYHYFKYEPIKWRVLDVDGDKALILADKALDDRQYNTVNESVTWEKSTTRSYKKRAWEFLWKG